MTRIVKASITGCSDTIGSVSGIVVHKVNISDLGIVGMGVESTLTL